MSDQAKITVTLTIEELAQIVCENCSPHWFEHRYLCHPERECESGCSVTADRDRLDRYQGFDPDPKGQWT